VKRDRGFTLIELMVVVIVIAILAAIAIPSYLNQTRKARRNGAEDALQQIALREERYRAECSGYCDASATPTGCSTCNWSALGGDPSGTYYTYTVTVASATSVAPATYSILATGKSTQLKDKDRSSGSDCKNLTYAIDTSGIINKTPTGCW
jgi:type IV pilus assembly protein PilE